MGWSTIPEGLVVHAQPASIVPGNPRGSPVHRVRSACWIQNRHRLFIGTCASICQWGLRKGHPQSSFRFLDAPERMHAHFEIGRSSRIAPGRRQCPTVNTAVNRVHPNNACGFGRGYQTIRRVRQLRHERRVRRLGFLRQQSSPGSQAAVAAEAGPPQAPGERRRGGGGGGGGDGGRGGGVLQRGVEGQCKDEGA